MTAPEIQVRVEHLPGGWWHARCEYCDEEYLSYEDSDDDTLAWAEHHETICAGCQLARLQARWDARDTALRALVAEWRAEERHTGIVAGSYAAGRIDSADELERAIGGDRD